MVRIAEDREKVRCSTSARCFKPRLSWHSWPAPAPPMPPTRSPSWSAAWRSRSICRPSSPSSSATSRTRGSTSSCSPSRPASMPRTSCWPARCRASVGFYDHCVDLQAKGKFVESVVQISQAPGEVELVSTKHPEIKSPADFKGKSLGVTGLGSSTNFLTQYLAVKNGVKLGEFTSVPVGAGDTFIAAMQQDKIQAGMTTEPTISRLLKTGEAKILVDMRTDGGDQGGARRHLSGRVALHADRLGREAQGRDAEARQRLRQDARRSSTRTRAAEIADKMPKEYSSATATATSRRSTAGKACSPPDGMMPEGGPETVLAVLSGFSKNLKGKTDRPLEDLHDRVRQEGEVAPTRPHPGSAGPARNAALAWRPVHRPRSTDARLRARLRSSSSTSTAAS